MALITVPRGINGVEWTAPTPAEYAAKSSYSGKATIVNRGGVTAGFRAKVSVAPRSNADVMAWKAFASLTQSKANVFRLPATAPGVQSALPLVMTVYGSGQHVNEFLHNNALSNVAWTQYGLTSILTNSDTTPIGGVGDSFTMLESAVTSGHGIGQTVATADVGKQYVLSVWARQRNRSRIGLVMGGDGQAIFNLATGTVISNTGVAAGIIADDFGWFRCWVAVNASSAVTNTFILISDTGDPSLSYLGNDAQGISVWRPQVEYGVRPSPIIINGATRPASLWTANLIGLAANSTIARAGSIVSFYDRMHVLSADLVTGGSGLAAMSVEPPLYRPTAAGDFVFAQSPFARMRMTSEMGWADRLGYGEPVSFECEEAL